MSKSKHDSFFCRSIENPAIAKAFIKQHLPSYLEKQIDWGNLYRIDRSNTDFMLKKLHRDIIYRAPMLQGEDIIFGLEHQSKDDPMMTIRYLRYDSNVLEAYMKEGHDKWPLIINFLVYNSPKAPSYLSEPIGYYKHKSDGKEYLHLFFYLINLMQISDKEILTHGICAPLEILLKHSFDGEFELNISAYQAAFHACINEVGNDYILTMLEYADSLTNFKIGEKMHKFVEELFENKPKIIMTYGQLLRREARKEVRKEAKQEGLQEGLQKGLQRGMETKAITVAKKMIKKGYDIASIQEITELSEEIIQKLKEE